MTFSPDPRNDAITVLRGQVEKARQLHEETGAVLARIEEELLRLQRR